MRKRQRSRWNQGQSCRSIMAGTAILSVPGNITELRKDTTGVLHRASPNAAFWKLSGNSRLNSLGREVGEEGRFYLFAILSKHGAGEGKVA